MKRFELVCIDMFQTLVDVDTRIPFIWKRILGDDYNELLKDRCADLVSSRVIDKFHEYVTQSQEFSNLKSMFNPCFSSISNEIGISFSPEEAVSIFLDEHGKASTYEDVNIFFEAIGSSVPVCLVSDADNEMVFPLIDRFKFDSVFISEKIKSYKNEKESRIFKEVLKHYDIRPEKVIHIGDASSDIIGANKFGITTCWINRNNREWRYNVQPDYIVKSLIEVIDILRLETNEKAI
jgi:HAD superfamily hydrolase (TIGR01549 family)